MRVLRRTDLKLLLVLVVCFTFAFAFTVHAKKNDDCCVKPPDYNCGQCFGYKYFPVQSLPEYICICNPTAAEYGCPWSYAACQ
ncbi:MAG: hypothetical protein JSV52_01885 [Candidatus Zixiibacteriota bacterium]|nr:MAG: hypothetical protein JSV52_01885 [candidate division Zixibacteria bacterium]